MKGCGRTANQCKTCPHLFLEDIDDRQKRIHAQKLTAFLGFSQLVHLLILSLNALEKSLENQMNRACQLLRGLIESVPLVSTLFRWHLEKGKDHSWFGLKMVNPEKLDNFDTYLQGCEQQKLKTMEDEGRYLKV